MRFPAPDRLKFLHVAIFAMVVFMGQELEGTDFVFATLTAIYILLWATAFNMSGGIRYPSGAFIFFNGFLNVIVGLGAKILLLQPGDRNLRSPDVTMAVYCVGMAGMMVALFVARGLRAQRALLPPLESTGAFKQAAIICLFFGAFVTLATVGGSNGVVTALRQLNKMPQMAIMLGTIYQIRVSKGRSSFNWIVVSGILFAFAMGLISFGKEGMLLGFVAYFFAATIEGYSFPKKQIFVGVICFAFFNYYRVTYSQYVREFRAPTFSENAAIAVHYLGNLNETRQVYEDTFAQYDIADGPHLYDKSEGFLDRLIILPADDSLINFTDKGNVYGLYPTYTAYANMVPHFLWPNKPEFNTGNVYSHELGQLADEDITTGISFSAAADAFHQEKWLGLLLLLPIDIFLYFLILDSLMGSVRWAPWGLISILELSEVGPAGGLDAPVYDFSIGLFGILFTVFVVKVAAPFVLRTLKREHIVRLATAPALRSGAADAS